MRFSQLPVTTLTTAWALSLLAACTTLSSGSDHNDELIKPGVPVVMQVGHDNPEMAPHERSVWLEQRQAKGLSARLNGNLATGEAENAVNLAKARLAEAPGDVQALIMLTSALVMQRNYELAGYYAAMLEQVQPGSPTALNVKGLAKLLAPSSRQRDYAQAALYFQQAMDADQTQVAPGLNLGYLQLELGNAAAASATFKLVSERCQGCLAGLLGEGMALSRNRQYPAAAEVFKRILSQKPNHPEALYNLALVYKNGYNDKAKAESYLTTLVRDTRTQDKTLKDRAQVVLRKLKGEAGASERTQIADDDLKAAPKDAEALMTGGEPDSAESE